MAAIDPISSTRSTYAFQWDSRLVSGGEGSVKTGAPASGGDQVELSPEARQKARAAAVKGSQPEKDADGLDAEQKKEVDHLKQRDQEVRIHEQAHTMAGGALVRGGATYSYRTGPDGKRYAVGGEVSIDTSPVDGDPRATIRKAQQIRKAALAPADPSGQDQAVAVAASNMETNAQRELSAQTSK